MTSRHTEILLKPYRQTSISNFKQLNCNVPLIFQCICIISEVLKNPDSEELCSLTGQTAQNRMCKTSQSVQEYHERETGSKQ